MTSDVVRRRINVANPVTPVVSVVRGVALVESRLPFSYPYTGRNANFVRVARNSSSNLETDGSEEGIQVIGDVLIEAVEGAAFFFRQEAVSTEGCQ